MQRRLVAGQRLDGRADTGVGAVGRRIDPAYRAAGDVVGGVVEGVQANALAHAVGDVVGRVKGPRIGRELDLLEADRVRARAGRGHAAHAVHVGAQVDGVRIGHDRHLGIVGRLGVGHDEVDQLVGRRLQAGKRRARHRAGVVDHERHLEVVARSGHLGIHGDRIVRELQGRIGRQADLGGGGDLGVACVGDQGEAGRLQGRARDQRQVGAQRLAADGVDGGVVGRRGPGGVQGRGVEGVLQLSLLLGHREDVEDAQRHGRQHREGDGEGHGGNATPVCEKPRDEAAGGKPESCGPHLDHLNPIATGTGCQISVGDP